jgi:hypothetical protein
VVQVDQKEDKSEQALQIIGHVVAEFYANKRSMHGGRQFYYYYLIQNGENVQQEQHFTFVRMGNALLPNAMPLVSRFFAEMSKKRQRCTLVHLENNFSISAKFTDVYCNCKRQLSQNKC